MDRVRPIRSRVGGSAVGIAAVLLLGVLVLAYGQFAGSRAAFWAGTLITLSGVLSGVLRIVVHGK